MSNGKYIVVFSSLQLLLTIRVGTAPFLTAIPSSSPRVQWDAFLCSLHGDAAEKPQCSSSSFQAWAYLQTFPTLLMPMLFETALLPSGVSMKPFVQVCGYVGMCTHTVKTYRHLHFSTQIKAEECLPSSTFSSCFMESIKSFPQENPCSGALESPC